MRIERPSRNSPTALASIDAVPLISIDGYSDINAEVAACADKISEFIEGGLDPHDIMAVAIDDMSARTYLSGLAIALSDKHIEVNNIIADRYSETPFLIEGKVTISTVHRAKGNESAVVMVLGTDAIDLRSRVGRNKLFTAFTRSKGWLRISGYSSSPHFKCLRKEMEQALELSPEVHFTMPDLKKIELVQRDLKEKNSSLLKAKIEMEKIKEKMKLTNDDLFSVLSGRA